MKNNIKYSLIVLIIISAFISIYRLSIVNKKEMAWDVLGYYLPLPATFVHHDPLLHNIDWLKQEIKEKELAGSLYMVSYNKKGEFMYFFFFGMAYLFLPFFFIGHSLAFLLGFSPDGFSTPYQYSMVSGGILFTIIGLIFLRKNLRHFFSEGISALVMLIIVFGTNYIHHLTIQNLEPVNALFMFANIIIWYTIKWHETHKLRDLIFIGLGITFMTLVKPSEIFIIVIPLLWNISSIESFKEKLKLILKNKKQIIITICISLILVLPQMVYWYIMTGKPVYDSYKNPGVGLDYLSPHIFEVLFSYRKGWLVYTPVMIFSLIGLYFVFRMNRKIFFAISVYFLMSFYIIASWTEWWYGAGFSTRPMITLYSVLAISLGYFLMYITERKLAVKLLFSIVVLFFIFLNQFQWWQLKTYILDPYRTTKEYYWATFLKTNVTEDDRKLLRVFRDFSGEMKFNNPQDYKFSILKNITFDDYKSDKVMTEENGNKVYSIKPDEEYVLTESFKYKALSSKDHIWVRVYVDIRYPENYKEQYPCFVISMKRKQWDYGYYAPEIKPDSINNKWHTYKFDYLTPEIRSTNDKLMFYIWNRGKSSFDIDNYKVEIYESVVM